MKTNEKREKAEGLKREASRLEQEAHEEERLERLGTEQNYRRTRKIDVYVSDDYAGLDAGDFSFYFGYEQTACPKHKTEEACERVDCEKREDCFVASISNKEVLRIPRSKLYPKEDEEPLFYVLAGIGIFLQNENKQHRLRKK